MLEEGVEQAQLSLAPASLSIGLTPLTDGACLVHDQLSYGDDIPPWPCS